MNCSGSKEGHPRRLIYNYLLVIDWIGQVYHFSLCFLSGDLFVFQNVNSVYLFHCYWCTGTVLWSIVRISLTSFTNQSNFMFKLDIQHIYINIRLSLHREIEK